MRAIASLFSVLLLTTLLLGGCGYYFPHVYDGPTRKIYMPTWKNRTSHLGMDTAIYQSLARWFQKSQSIILTRDRKEADLILAGEILSIVLPSVSWDSDARATEVKVRLEVRYVLKDLHTGDILWEVPRELWTEEYSTRGGSAAMADSEQEALEIIREDLSERIYLGTLEKLRRLDMKEKAPQPSAADNS